MSIAYGTVSVVCGEVDLSDAPLREHGDSRTQEMILEIQLLAFSRVYCVETASGCSGWIVFWLC